MENRKAPATTQKPTWCAVRVAVLLTVVIVLMRGRTARGIHSFITSNDYAALLPAEHPLASRRRLTLAALADEPFVDTPAGFGNRVFLDRALRAAGIQRTVVAEVAELPSVPSSSADAGRTAAVQALLTVLRGASAQATLR